MRRFSDELFDTVFYLYRSRYDAERASRLGGCGFFTSIRSNIDPQRAYMYGVTNAHVIENDFLILRLNSSAGGFSTITTFKNNWYIHPQDDIAACLLPLDGRAYKGVTIQTEVYATHDVLAKHNIGPGDEVFMVGRFSRFEGSTQNRPVMRFGNISRLPGEAIRFHAGHEQDGFLVDMRSLPGFSGSPVFVHIPGSQLRWGNEPNTLTLPFGPWLLGIDHGSSEKEWPVLDEGGCRVEPHMHVAIPTGLCVVIPAYKILEVLVDARDKLDDAIQAISASPVGTSNT